mgnify:CR=1 FL=1
MVDFFHEPHAIALVLPCEDACIVYRQIIPKTDERADMPAAVRGHGRGLQPNQIVEQVTVPPFRHDPAFPPPCGAMRRRRRICRFRPRPRMRRNPCRILCASANLLEFGLQPADDEQAVPAVPFHRPFPVAAVARFGRSDNPQFRQLTSSPRLKPVVLRRDSISPSEKSFQNG